MIQLRELDENTTYLEQLQVDVGPIVLINTFTVPIGTVGDVIAVWAEDAAFMKAKPGYISAQLHRGIGESGTLVNVAVWESVAALRDAFSDPEFKAKMAAYPDGAVASPHVFQRVAVPGVCLGEV